MKCSNPNCTTEISSGKKCNACKIYFGRHGKERTPDVMRTQGGATGFCKHCREKPAHAKNLCGTCLQYKARHGKMRPHRLIRVARRHPCRNCGKPWKVGHFSSTGRCVSCERYKRKHGVEKPQEKWTTLHWCNCGEPAKHHVWLSVSKSTEEYWLCEQCAQWADEMEMAA